jgi:Protein of unknown function (DUF2911)
VSLWRHGCNAHKEINVKTILTTLFLFALGSMSYAATTGSGSVSFPSAVRVGQNNLPAGNYAVHWQEGSNEVQVTLSGHGHQVSVPATVAPGAGADEVLMRRDGTAEVVEGFTVKATSFTHKTP